MTSLLKPLPEPTHRATARANLLTAWEKRRPAWTRTDTARHLNDRSEAILALLRRRPGQWPKHTHQVGYWLKEHAPALFDRAHATLAAATLDPARERLLPSDLV